MGQTKQDRLVIVNQIIDEIASRGRRFFFSKKTNSNAYLFLKNGRVYYKCEHYGNNICLSIPEYRRPKNWQHGGTLKALIFDFRDFINHGGDTNHNHGYGGLYCPHWGYPEEDMLAIQAKSIELGYLQPR